MADFKVRYVTTTSANLNSVPIVERQVVHVTNTSPNQLYVDANGARHNITDKTVIIWGGYRDRSMFGTPNPAMWYFVTGTREFFAWDNAAAAGSIIQAQWNNVPVDAVIARVASGGVGIPDFPNSGTGGFADWHVKLPYKWSDGRDIYRRHIAASFVIYFLLPNQNGNLANNGYKYYSVSSLTTEVGTPVRIIQHCLSFNIFNIASYSAEEQMFDSPFTYKPESGPATTSNFLAFVVPYRNTGGPLLVLRNQAGVTVTNNTPLWRVTGWFDWVKQ